TIRLVRAKRASVTSRKPVEWASMTRRRWKTGSSTRRNAWLAREKEARRMAQERRVQRFGGEDPTKARMTAGAAGGGGAARAVGGGARGSSVGVGPWAVEGGSFG